MMKLLHLLNLAALLAATTTASYIDNLNYQSPSLHHPHLGLSLRKIAKRHDARVSFDTANLNFTHGVASGDPWANSVILWTRVAPVTESDRSNVTVSGFVPLYDHSTKKYVQASKAPICVKYVVSNESSLAAVVDSGEAWTSSDIDYTVKVEAKHLQPFTEYYYQFSVCNSTVKSVVGQAKTIPGKHDKVNTSVKLAIYSCSNYPFGFFNAYGNVARKSSVDFAVHLGDYIYEYKNGDYGWGDSVGRIPLPDKELYSLYDYRERHNCYRTDLDALELHRTKSFFTVWDDHEVADNTWKAGSSGMNNTEESFLAGGDVAFDQRKMNAVRAYFEWMPIRQTVADDNLRIWRSFSIGTLFDLIMVDTRQYDRSITDLYWNTHYVAEIADDGGRSLMGSAQENWFFNQLSESEERGAAWRVIGNQIVFSRINESIARGNTDPLNGDSWDGYQASRNRTLNHLYSNQINNTIFLSGDSHASWVTDLVWLDVHPYNASTGAGSIGVEFAGTAVSSPSPAGQNVSIAFSNAAASLLVGSNEELQWNELYYRGYYELDISYESVEAKYFGLPTIATRNGWEIPLANFTVMHGENKLMRSNGTVVVGGVVEAGSLKGGLTVGTNITVDTNNGTWFVSNVSGDDTA